MKRNRLCIPRLADAFFAEMAFGNESSDMSFEREPESKLAVHLPQLRAVCKVLHADAVSRSELKPKAILFDPGNTLVIGNSSTPHKLLTQILSPNMKQVKIVGSILITYPASMASKPAVALKPILAYKDGAQSEPAAASVSTEQEQMISGTYGGS